MTLWTPAEITTALWLDASDAGSITESGGVVSQWDDLSGNGRNFSQGTGGLQPTYTAAGLNSLAVVDFADDYLTSDSVVSTWTFMHDGTGASVFLVVKPGTTANPDARYGFMGTGSGSSSQIGYTLNYDDRSSSSRSDGAVMLVARGVSADASVDHYEPSYLTPNAYQILAAISDPANATSLQRSKFHLNGESEQTGNTETGTITASNATNNMSLGNVGGNASPLTGGIAEVLIVSGVVGTTSRQRIEGYLAWKWGLEANLASGHPYESAPPTTQVLNAATGTYALAGQDAAATVGYQLAAVVGAYALTGRDAGLTSPVAYSIAAATAAYAITGQGITINQGQVIEAEGGAFAVTGQPAAFTAALSLAAGAGAYALSGNAAETVYGGTTAYDLTTLVGGFAWDGAAVTVRKGFRITAARGQFPVIGRANLTNRQRTMTAARGELAITGSSAFLAAPGGRRRFALIT